MPVPPTMFNYDDAYLVMDLEIRNLWQPTINNTDTKTWLWAWPIFGITAEDMSAYAAETLFLEFHFSQIPQLYGGALQ